MPSIRFPSTALPLLPLCKGHGSDFIFRTYADLIGFVAAYGYHLIANELEPLPDIVSFEDTPTAIGLETFENRGLYHNFIIIALAYDHTRKIADNDIALATFIEKLCAVGAEYLAARTNNGDLTEIAELISDSSKRNEFTRI